MPIGQTQDAGWEIGVSKTLPVSRDDLWRFLTSPEGLALWLGEGVSLTPVTGSRYVTDGGTTGEVRSFHELNRIRITWWPKGWDHESTVQVAMRADGGRTLLRFHQERLADADERAKQREHWQAVMGVIVEALGLE